MRRDFIIEKLSDEFGQYDVLLVCKCGHTRKCRAQTLAKIAGWEAQLADVAKRMRCSKCGKRGCEVRTLPLTAPRGWKSH